MPAHSSLQQRIGAFKADVPTSWKSQPITSQMRVAHYKIGEKSELIVYYFGEGGAGPVEANLERWRGQFTDPGGGQVKDRVEKRQLGALAATVMWVSGNYNNTVTNEAQSDVSLLAAIIEGGVTGPLYFRLVGPKPEVVATEKAFLAMLSSLREGH